MARESVLMALVFLAAAPVAAEGSEVGTCGAAVARCQVCECNGPGFARCAACETGYVPNVRGTACIPERDASAVQAPARAQWPTCGELIEKCETCACQGPDHFGCTVCRRGYRPGAGGSKCESECTSIDPLCTACGGGVCRACVSGYGTNAGGSACIACDTIDPRCTSCAGGLCTGCLGGYGTNGGGTACIECTSLDSNCSGCAAGVCTQCTNGYAADLAGDCVQPGSSGCSFDLDGQCCRCKYSCQTFAATTGPCEGDPSNSCGDCPPENRQ